MDKLQKADTAKFQYTPIRGVNANSTRMMAGRYMMSSDGAVRVGRKAGRPTKAKVNFSQKRGLNKTKNYSEADMGDMSAYGKTLKGLKNYTGR